MMHVQTKVEPPQSVGLKKNQIPAQQGPKDQIRVPAKIKETAQNVTGRDGVP
jgi:hypothetical protein